MAFLMSAVDLTAPKGLWEWLIINVFGFIGNYGWRVVVLVVFLKLLLSPLDFYQRYKMRKNQRITEQLKPQLEKLEKQYGEDKQALQRKQMELNKKAGFSYMSACIPMIITLVLFITFYTALRSVSVYMEFKQYVEMHDTYVAAYEQTGFDYVIRTNGTDFSLSDSRNGNALDFQDVDEWLSEVYKSEETLKAYISSPEISQEFNGVTVFNPETVLMRYKTDYIDAGKSYADYVADFAGTTADKSDADDDFNLAMSILMQVKAQEAAVEAYEQSHTSFLWIKSLWVADVPWANSLPDWDKFSSSMKAQGYLDEDVNKNPAQVYLDNPNLYNNLIKSSTYNIVTAKIRQNDELYKTNGYLIMVFLVIGLSVLSQFISNRQQKKSGQVPQGNGGTMMKTMLIMMPLMLAVFALTSSSAFTVYMVANSIMTLIINLVTTLIVNLMDGGFKKQDTVIVKHGRLDPNDRIKK